MAKSKKMILAQIISFAISSLMICLSPICSYDEEKAKMIMSIIISVFFWIGLIVGIIFNILLSKDNKLLKGKMGIISFFKNKAAIIFDILFVISLILSLIVVVSKTALAIGSVAIAICIFSFEMHCVLNGKCFNKLILKAEEK